MLTVPQNCPPRPPPIFVGGAVPGTTLVRVFLDSHPHIAWARSLRVIWQVCQLWHTCNTNYPLEAQRLTRSDLNGLFADLILGLLDKYRQHAGKARVAEKTPANIIAFHQLNELFPEKPAHPLHP